MAFSISMFTIKNSSTTNDRLLTDRLTDLTISAKISDITKTELFKLSST